MSGERKKKDKRKKGQNSPDTNIVPQEFKRFNIDMSSQQPQASANFMYQTYSHPNVPYGPPYYGSPPPPLVPPPGSQVSPHMQPLPVSPASPQVLAQSSLSGDVVTKLFERLDMMDKKLFAVDQKVSQLETIQNSLTNVTVKVNTMSAKVTTMETQMSNLERSRQFDSKTLDEMKKKQSDLEKMIKKMEKSENEQKERLLDLQCRQMRDNLIFYNIRDERQESDEECVNKLYNFLEDDLKITNARMIKTDRVHRLGRYSPVKTRPIIVKFCFYQDREMIRKAAKTLEGTQYSISQQFPKEINSRRKALVPTLKSLKEEGHRAYISVDKLYVDGELYTGKLVQPQDQSSNGDRRPGVARGAMRGRGHGYGQGHGQGRGWGNRYEVLGSRDGSEPGHSRSSSVENGRAQDGQGHDNGQGEGEGQMETEQHEGEGHESPNKTGESA